MQIAPIQSPIQQQVIPPQAIPVTERVTPVEPSRRVTQNREPGNNNLAGQSRDYHSSSASARHARGQHVDVTV